MTIIQHVIATYYNQKQTQNAHSTILIQIKPAPPILISLFFKKGELQHLCVFMSAVFHLCH